MTFKFILFIISSFLFVKLAFALELKENDFFIKKFKFNSGEILPELKLHYTTIGTLQRDTQGRALNAVLLLHGTTGVGRNFLKPSISNYLFGSGQPLDADKYFIIMPDGIGRGKSSKPSDGLKAKFPHYGYQDMVKAQYELVRNGLKIDHLKLILGTSMGGMQTWLWGEQYPDMMDALMPIASQPVAVTGRNFLWRNLIMEAIKTDPDYNQGNYKNQPQQFQKVLPLFNLMTGSVKNLEEVAKTQIQAQETFDKWVNDYKKTIDANDYLYGLAAVSDYDPEPHLDKIKAKVLAINFADDLLNPVQLKVLEKTIAKVKNGKFVIIPEGPDTKGHQSLAEAKLWVGYLEKLLDSIEDDKRSQYAKL